MAKAQRVEVPITARMEQGMYDRLCALIPGEQDGAHKIGETVNGLLEDMSEGGMMLSGSDVERIRTSLPGADADAIIEAAEKAAGMQDGGVVVAWRVDDTLLEPLQQIADEQSLTVQEIVQNMMDYAIKQGWFYSVLVDQSTLFLSKEGMAYLRQITGIEELSGEKLVEFLESHAVPDEADDLAKAFAEDGEQKQLQASGA